MPKLLTKGTSKAIGRPPIFTQAAANEICERLGCGECLRAICKDEHLPSERSVLMWLQRPEYEAFLRQYVRAREVQAERYAEEIIAISDDDSRDYIDTEDGPKPNPEMVQRAKLRVDSRKWVASKLLPKKYGEQLDVTVNGQVTHLHATPERLRELVLRAHPELAGPVVTAEVVPPQ